MKIEIEITEDEIRDVISRKVRVAIADQTNHWSIDEFIRITVSRYWKEMADHMVREALENSEAMRSKIIASIEAKLRAQVSKLMKEQGA